jgi:hypothetical protein
MAEWDKVIAGFNGEDETANFGTRAMAHGDTSIYESNTLATIQSNDKVNFQVNIFF